MNMHHQPVVEHHIQREILQRLAGHGELRFSQLKPAGMESNVFMYHASALRKMGLLEKTAAAYRLTTAGLRYVDRLSGTTLRPRLQPKVICVLIIKDDGGHIAMLQRHTAPYAGQLMLPSGKMHFKETLLGHAARELQEKTGLVVPLKKRGLANIPISGNEGVITHALAVVWEGGTVGRPRLQCSDTRFNPLWAEPAQDNNMYMPGTLELLQHAQSGELFISDVAVG